MKDFENFKNSLNACLIKDGIKISENQTEKLFAYRVLLSDWNSKINLYSKRDEDRMEEVHFADSIIPYIKISKMNANRITDIGSGNGFPALPLALMLPEKSFTLIEVRHKRAAFLKEAVHCMELKNAKILCMDISGFDWSETDLITGRAFKGADEIKRILEKLRAYKDFMVWEKRGGERAVVYKYCEKCSTWNIEV